MQNECHVCKTCDSLKHQVLHFIRFIGFRLMDIYGEMTVIMYDPSLYQIVFIYFKISYPSGLFGHLWRVKQTSAFRVRSCLVLSVCHLGDWTIAVAGLHAWNSLPHSVADCSSPLTFKKYVTTYLFSLSF